MKLQLVLLSTLIASASLNAQTNSTKQAVPLRNCLQDFQNIFPVSFNYGESIKLNPAQQPGFITEEVKKVFPELIVQQHKNIPSGKNSYKTITYESVDLNKMIPFLVKAIQELQAEVDSLKPKQQQAPAVPIDGELPYVLPFENFLGEQPPGCMFIPNPKY